MNPGRQPVTFFTRRKSGHGKWLAFASLPSTNDWVKNPSNRRLLRNGTVVLAQRQTAGRGRVGKTWHHGEGNLAFSIFFEDAERFDSVPVTVLAGLALSRFLRRRIGVPNRIKWPNDVLIGNAKVAGILCENFSDLDGKRALVCGIGVNLSSAPAIKDRKNAATCVAEWTTRSILPFTWTETIVEAVEKTLRQALAKGTAEPIRQWNEASGMTGKNVSFHLNGTAKRGRVLGVDPQGNLRVLTCENSDVAVLRSGEISVLL